VAVNLFISYWVLSSTTDGSSQVIPPFFLSGDRRSEAAATVKRVRVEETIKGRVGEAKTWHDAGEPDGVMRR
jgi:hypothetical protein